MQKFQVTIYFTLDDEFMELVPMHRAYITELIANKIIENYAVSMDSYRSWILFNAETKEEVMDLLSKSPLFKYWKLEIDRLFVYDGITYRLPDLVLN
ncbi:MAG TPA: muconolactone Delta-isomerase family protein [Chitinophagaceae bacterium]|jgi:muconolactone delta-isomerase|nr:muconolactone Delta-isomerase family protein [Chitinophagaceae bacterium]